MFVYCPGFRWKEQPVRARTTPSVPSAWPRDDCMNFDITLHIMPVYTTESTVVLFSRHFLRRTFEPFASIMLIYSFFTVVTRNETLWLSFRVARRMPPRNHASIPIAFCTAIAIQPSDMSHVPPSQTRILLFGTPVVFHTQAKYLF
jgi:hypothetical protein